MANPFKEAELRKQEEARRLAEEARKREEEAKALAEKESEKAEENTEAVAKEEETASVVQVQEAETTSAPVNPDVQEEEPAVAEEPVEQKEEKPDFITALREQVDSDIEKHERKVAINIMVPPSLKRKMERDVRNRKFRSMSYLITALLKEYYK